MHPVDGGDGGEVAVNQLLHTSTGNTEGSSDAGQKDKMHSPYVFYANLKCRQNQQHTGLRNPSP